MFKNGETIKAKDVLGKKGRAELAKRDLRSIYQEEIESCLQSAHFLNSQIKIFHEKIRKQVELSEDARLLMSIPGISFFSALLITSEIGDYHRFRSSRKLCCWAGLVPSVYSSGGKTRRGKIIKQGSANLRFVLLQVGPHVIKKSSHLWGLYTRVQRKHGKKTARIAVARKLLSIILMMLKTKEPFRANWPLKRKGLLASNSSSCRFY